MIDRDLRDRLIATAGAFPAVTLTGPRQSGKSTLCRQVFPQHAYANLEAPDIRAFAAEDPRGFLAQFPHGAVIDEVQRCPELPSYLQERIDADPSPGRWILTGSQNLSLLTSVSQSLAGRTALLHLLPLARNEVRRFEPYPRELHETLWSGGYPRIFDRRLSPAEWLGAYVGTYLERDVRTISNVGDLASFQQFVQLCAGRTAQLANLTALGSDCGISHSTARAWLSILETSFIVFRLPAFSGGPRKRLARMPKLHFYDTGLVCWLLGIRTPDQLRTHPLRGAIFETWVVSEIVKHRMNRGERGGVLFFRDQHGLEADAVIEHADRLTVVEAKASQTPTGELADSVRRVASLLAAVRPTTAIVAYGGDSRMMRSDVSLIPWDTVDEHVWV